MDEGYEALTLMQTGKSQLMPLVLIDRQGGTYWKTWDKHVREHLLRDQLIDARTNENVGACRFLWRSAG